MSDNRQNLWKDEGGAALLEFTAAAFTFFVILYGVIEFAQVFYQWNAATKATQYGARLAAVSDPVARNLATLTGTEAGALPGTTMPNFDCVCQVTSGAVACTGTVPAGASACSLSSANGVTQTQAMDVIVYGRSAAGVPNTSCQSSASTTFQNLGMCNLYSSLTAANIVVEYKYTGLGYVGRSGGPVPTITVSLKGLTYNFVLVGGLANLTSMQLPPFATTVTGEDLNPAGS